MAEQIPPNPPTLHDRLFKEFLHRFLREFMEIFFPVEAARLDFTTVAFLQQELVINLPGQVLRLTDVVAELNTLDGEPEAIILHVDVEANKPKPLPKRMFDYYALLRILLQRQVLPIALVLKPGVGGLKWHRYTEKLFDQELIRFRYGQVGLRDLKSAEYLALNHPVAAMLATLMKPAESSTAAVKLNALQIVVKSNLTEGDKLFLIKMVETYLPVGQVFDAQEEVMQALAEVELTWVDRALQEGEQKGRQEGRQEGVQAGMRQLLLLLLAQKFGDLPVEFVERLNAITDPATFAQLSSQVLTAQRLSDITLPNLQDKPVVRRG